MSRIELTCCTIRFPLCNSVYFVTLPAGRQVCGEKKIEVKALPQSHKVH